MNLIIQEWALILTAFGAFIAALAAAIGVIATFRAARGSLVEKLYDEYWSVSYLQAVNVVNEWKEKYGNEYAQVFGERRRKKKTLSEEEKNELERVNEARRAVKGYFRKAHQLCTKEYLKESDVFELLCPPHRSRFLIEVIEAFEPEIKKDYTREMYDFYRKHLQK